MAHFSSIVYYSPQIGRCRGATLVNIMRPKRPRRRYIAELRAAVALPAPVTRYQLLAPISA